MVDFEYFGCGLLLLLLLCACRVCGVHVQAKQVLGWEAKRTAADMCKDTWNWQSNNPNGLARAESE